MNRLQQKLSTLVILLSLSLFANCKKQEEAAEVDERQSVFGGSAQSIEATGQNNLENEPTAFLRSRQGDAVNWQAWTPELLDWAHSEQRPILAVVANGDNPLTHSLLDELSSEGNKLAREMNESCVCTLVDVNANPELVFLAVRLTAEIGQPFGLPLFVWLTHEGNPVASSFPLASSVEGMIDAISESHSVVMNIWENSPSYIVKDSGEKAEGRREAVLTEIDDEERPDRAQAHEMLVESAGSLTALYDPASRSIDQVGGMLPSRMLGLSSSLADFPGLPAYLLPRAQEVVVEVLGQLMRSPMRDPLDQGMFDVRRGRGWVLPFPTKSVSSGAAASIAFAEGARLDESGSFATVAKELLQHQSETMGADGEGVGSYQSVVSGELGRETFFWKQKEIEELLTPQQFSVVSKAASLDPRGNIPSLNDPQAEYFQLNALAEAMTIEEIAKELGRDENEVQRELDAAWKALGAVRSEKVDSKKAVFVEDCRVAQHNADYARALLRSGDLLGDSALVDQGKALLSHMRGRFYSEKGGLWRIPPQEGRRGVKARGIDYACLIAAVLECYRLRLDEADLVWAESLARELTLRLASDDSRVGEISVEEAIVKYPYENREMVLGASTWGVLFGSMEQLRRVSDDKRFGEVADTLSAFLAPWLAKRVVAQTDYAQGLMVLAQDRVALLHGSDKELLDPLHRALRDHAFRGTVILGASGAQRKGSAEFPVPEGSGVTVVRNGKALQTFTSPEELREFLLNDLPGE